MGAVAAEVAVAAVAVEHSADIGGVRSVEDFS